MHTTLAENSVGAGAEPERTGCSCPLSAHENWEISLKWYPHFDAIISEQNIYSLVSDPARVAANTFYPFLRYVDSWQPYRLKATGKPAKKQRPIRFASRRDAYIFSYYRHMLAEKYEELRLRDDLSDVVIAYRKIVGPTGRGKSNIEFAKDAFDGVAALGSCAVVTLDISSFFEHLDHDNLRRQWCRILGIDRLPPDHQAIFKALTRYAVVDRDDVYRRLGFLEDRIVDGKVRAVYTVAFKDMPKKLCTNADFQNKICGGDKTLKSLVDNNRTPYGIPQGSPMSDLLANFYMIDFDKIMKAYCRERGGFYLRYSDDLLLVVPGGAPEALAACDAARQEISCHGPKLKIKDKKTAILTFEKDAGGFQKFSHIGGSLGMTGLEYLGFRYDGRYVCLRNSTLSNLYRKISAAVRAECHSIVSRYPGRDHMFLMAHFDFQAFYQRYGRVKEFDPKSDVREWTFWTYAHRATKIFGRQGLKIPKQLRHFRDVIQRRVDKDMATILAKRT